jgi:hypothetical protein
MKNLSKASKKIKSEVTTNITSSLKARQFREKLTRVVAPVIPGQPTQAKQSNRYTP